MAKRITIHDLRRMKGKGEKIAMITCYDYASAKIIDTVGIPVILVGDSLGMVMHGHDSTLRVTLEMMILHSRAVARATTSAMVVVDMPFGTYSSSDLPMSLQTARRAISEGGATAVKIEGGRRMAPVVGTLVASGIPVMGHIGLTPQSVHMIGGYRVQGRGEEAGDRLVKAAKALEEAGAFAIVLECVPAKLAKRIARELTIPAIGIGAGPEVDGQVQVWHDLMGLLDDMHPKHAKAYANIAETMREAASGYFADVVDAKFPGPEHSFDVDELLNE